MRFSPTEIAGVWLIDLDRHEDERGFFARTFSARELGGRGLCDRFVEHSISHNRRRGTLRGLHWQEAPHQEEKLVRCTMGALFDVVADLRPGSPSFARWISVELSAENGRQLYVPAGVAHGFQTLTDDCQIEYLISAEYHAELSRGARWDDPSLAIRWPMAPTVISQRDRSFPDLAQGGGP